MPNHFALLLVLAAVAALTAAQQPVVPALERQAATDPESGIRYVLLTVPGKSISAPSQSAAELAAPTQGPHLVAEGPQLVAVCSITPEGKYIFEVLTRFDAAVDPLAFSPPWRPKPGELFPPSLTPVTVTMAFLGYTKIKPVRRIWETLLQPAGWLRYSTPGLHSHNMEQITFYLQILRALPTLRLSVGNSSIAEFSTTGWLQAIRAEPLCHASSL